MIRILFLFLFSSFFFTSCTSSKSKNEKEIAATDSSNFEKENFATGIIIEKVICKKDTSLSYTLYLPKNYSNKQNYPVLYAFDPQGKGKIPVELYKNLAEQNNYILIGSNNSKNGNSWDQSKAIADHLFSDSQNRLSINPKRIYLLGFSGGARIANALTVSNGSISDVICCGASNPSINIQDPRSNYTFLGICGTSDFNYIEMGKYDMIGLAGRNVKHTLLEFEGKHEWPNETIMREAFLWLELNAMRTQKIPLNDSLIKNIYTSAIQKVEEEKNKGKLYEAYNSVKKQITFLDGLIPLDSLYNIYNELKTTPEIDKGLKLKERLWKDEEKLQQYYINALQKENLSWWNKEVSSINREIKNGSDKNKANIYKRIFSYLSLISYMQTTGALKEKNMPAAKFFSEIYLLVDATNNEAHYLKANISAQEGDKKTALQFLDNAVKNGFNDASRLKNDIAFKTINTSNEFKLIIERLEKDKSTQR